jgi:hypothetical protein
MRTKTLALSAVLGALGATSLVAQTNVYSLNAVGYINVTLPQGFSIVTCPLICSPSNTVANLFPNTPAAGGAYQYCTVYPYVNGVGFGVSDNAGEYAPNGTGWQHGGLETLNPGQAIFFYNASGADLSTTFVGTVPQGSLTNQLVTGFNLVGSIVPTSGDLSTNSISGNFAPGGFQAADTLFLFDTGPQSYEVTKSVNLSQTAWNHGNPVTSNVYEGFFYYNSNYNSQGTENWVENFSINP